MNVGVTILFYGVVGAGVAFAEYLRSPDSSRIVRLFDFLGAAAFWPIYLPVLLAPKELAAAPAPVDEKPIQDAMAKACGQVEAELDAALSSLDGWAEGVLDRERGRIAELKQAWTSQACRVREMDRLLAEPAFADESEPGPPDGIDADVWTDRLKQREETRRENLRRLRNVRRQSYEDLMATLAWVRELVTMIHLAKFTGAPASRAEELVAQIAAAVEGLSEVTAWKDQTAERHSISAAG